MLEMKPIFFKILSTVALILIGILDVKSQTVPVGIPVLEDYYRRKQLLGEVDSNISFTIRPLFVSPILKLNNQTQNEVSIDENPSKKWMNFKLLPISWQQQFNTNSPYGWNDGAMIPSKGYQTMVSGGLFAKLGPLSVQLRPEYVYAINQDFDVSDIYGGAPDIQPRFGKTSYSKANWGQSSIRLTLGSVSAGISNENLWWGPGKRNALLMSNNIQGFKHVTLNTARPVSTPIGSFEMQIIGGKLEGSGYSKLENDPTYSDWRYLSAFVINYHPKWVPGLFLGLTRGFQTYQKDLRNIGDYVPFLTPFQKVNTENNGDPIPRDQLTSIYARWVFQKVHAEVYVEFGKNDNAYNFRDFLGSPEHSRSYIFGMCKLIGLKNKQNQFVQVNAEVTQMSQTIDRIIRGAGAWYYHSEVRHGYTNKGEVIGAGVGPGGNLQSLDISWVKGLKKVGLQMERYVHNNDYYNTSVMDFNNLSRQWVDYTIAAHSEWDYKNLLVNAKLQAIRSLNYQWGLKGFDSNSYYIPHNDVFNFHFRLGAMYRF